MTRDEIIKKLSRLNDKINNVPGNPASIQDGGLSLNIGELNLAERRELVTVIGKWHHKVVEDRAAPLKLEKKELEKALLDSFERPE